ncbi:MAG: hypothetical protein RR630_09600 [Coprobacillus sp.]
MKNEFDLELILLNESTFQEYLKQINSFKSKINSNLAKYLKKNALYSFCNHKSITYLVVDTFTKEVAAYFSISAFSFLSIDRNQSQSIYKSLIPVILLENFATNIHYVKSIMSNRKMGIIIFNDFIIPLVKLVQNEVGIFGIGLFAADEAEGRLVSHYQKNYGFNVVDVNDFDVQYPSYDENCIFMFCRI